MTYVTGISNVKPDKIEIRQYPIEELIGKISFGDAVYLLWVGKLPKRSEGTIVEAILVAVCDHSFVGPSTMAARYAASARVELPAAVAAGIASIGEAHGGAAEECARLMVEYLDADARNHPSPKVLEHSATQLVTSCIEQGRRVPGIGHPMHLNDPRIPALLELAESHGLVTHWVPFLKQIQIAASSRKGKPLPINIDGAIAGLMLELGVPPSFGKALFLLGRAAGICAHVHEELGTERPFRSVRWDEIQFNGPTAKEDDRHED